MDYFDNAATTYPKPRKVYSAVLEAMELYGANPGRSGHKMSFDTAVKIFEAREAAAMLFNAERAEDVVFTSNCTHAINFALKGALRPGDHVIISDIEHNSVLRSVHALKSRGVITYDVGHVYEDHDDVTVESFRRLIGPKTSMIVCSHGSNVWGIKAPLEKLGALAKEHDILFLVDAAQTAGVVPIDMRKCGIDFLCTAGHKSLYGPSGTGLLITPLGSALDCLFEGGTGTLSAQWEQPMDMPERLESGTVNTCGIIGLHAGISYVNSEGIENIYLKSMEIGRDIYEGLRNIKGAKLYTKDFLVGRHLPVISFNIDGVASEDATAMLSDMGFAVRGGLHCAPLAHRKAGTLDTGAVRVSIGSFNTKRQAERFLAAVSNIKAG